MCVFVLPSSNDWKIMLIIWTNKIFFERTFRLFLSACAAARSLVPFCTHLPDSDFDSNFIWRKCSRSKNKQVKVGIYLPFSHICALITRLKSHSQRHTSTARKRTRAHTHTVNFVFVQFFWNTKRVWTHTYCECTLFWIVFVCVSFFMRLSMWKSMRNPIEN